MNCSRIRIEDADSPPATRISPPPHPAPPFESADETAAPRPSAPSPGADAGEAAARHHRRARHRRPPPRPDGVAGASGALRCYRLNLERPFDIHAEQSPLEYGDYMKVWNEEDHPPTVGPTEYVPPRHLGGTEGVWRTLMRWGRPADGDGDGRAKAPGADPGRASWRILSPAEESAHRRLGRLDEGGEYTFESYDLTHVVRRSGRADDPDEASQSQDEASQSQDEGSIHDADAPTPEPSPSGPDGPFRPFEAGPSRRSPPRSLFLSIHSSGSEIDRLSPKTSEEMADETARLFRRSELSLREKEEEEARKAEEERREAEERRRKDGASASKSKRFSKKSLLRSLSSIGNKIAEMNSSSHSTSTGYRGYRACSNPRFAKKSSRQASAIEKARDLIDNELEGEDDDTENKKPQNLSLQIYGEYDVLNDLVNDGAKRLSRSRHLTDLELLMQNLPAPPPDRWVRPTGWGKCNPSSLYAAELPEGYDLNCYGKNKVKVPSEKGETQVNCKEGARESESAHPPSPAEDPNRDCGTQTTAAVSRSNSEEYESSARRRKQAAHSPVPLKTLPTESCGTPQGGECAVPIVAERKAKKNIGRRISGIMGRK